jgi:hypothetical protein
VPAGTVSLRRALALPARELWVIGDSGTTLRWNGAAWSAVPAGTTANLLGLWGSGPADLWAVGTGGTILRWNGAAWTPFPGPARSDLYAVWGSGPDEVWLAGAAGTLLRFDGTQLQPVAAGTTASLLSLFGSAGEVWAAGSGGTLLRLSGGAVIQVVPFTTAALTGIWASQADDLWLCSSSGQTWHGDGDGFVLAATPGAAPLYGLTGSGSADSVYAVGGSGTVLRYSP